MAKKESPKKENNLIPEAAGRSFRIAAVGGRLFGVIKFILGILLLFLVYSSTVAFFNEFVVVDKPLQNSFWAGVISLLVLYLFIWEPAIIYAKGRMILEFVFSFFRPMVKVAPYLLPIYTIVFFLLYLALSLVSKSGHLLKYFLFLFGFSIALHLVFGAKSLRLRQEDFLKANYIFGFSFVYIVNLFLLALFLNLIFEKFSLVDFSNNSFQIAQNIFYAVFKQLFIP